MLTKTKSTSKGPDVVKSVRRSTGTSYTQVYPVIRLITCNKELSKYSMDKLFSNDINNNNNSNSNYYYYYKASHTYKDRDLF